MLKILIPKQEFWNSEKECFYSVEEKTLCFEHSLYSISKWESKWHKPFLSENEKTQTEVYDYLRCMCLDENVDIETIYCLTNDDTQRINEYINDSMTATWFREDNNKPKSREIITSEIIYYWMTELNIPFECDRWHFNKLMTLIKVCSIKKQPPKKMGKRDIMRNNHAINEARKAKLGTRG